MSCDQYDNHIEPEDSIMMGVSWGSFLTRCPQRPSCIPPITAEEAREGHWGQVGHVVAGGDVVAILLAEATTVQQSLLMWGSSVSLMYVVERADR